jgi:hypothetical protein
VTEPTYTALRAHNGDPHPDCGHEWHGADGGACPGCGLDSHPIPDQPAQPAGLGPWDRYDTCGRCVLVAAIGGPVRAAQAGCPEHGIHLAGGGL